MATPSPRPTTRSPRTEHGLSTLAIDVGVDPRDVEVVTCWLTPDDEHLDDAELEAELRGILDPPHSAQTWIRSACPECGCLPGPNLVLIGWHPCHCGGHTTTYCRPETDGYGHERFEPAQDPETCRDAPFGFSEQLSQLADSAPSAERP